MNNITFKSDIKHVNANEFHKIIMKIPKNHCSTIPWTMNQAVCGRNAYTCWVSDCTVFALTDGKKVLLMHMCADEEENFDFNKISEFIKLKIKYMRKEYIQGFLLGSRESISERSKIFFYKFKNFLDTNFIPYSMFRDLKGINDVAYESIEDTWYIHDSGVEADKLTYKNNSELLHDRYKEVKICDFDEIV